MHVNIKIFRFSIFVFLDIFIFNVFVVHAEVHNKSDINQQWSKNGKSILDVNKDVLRCGFLTLGKPFQYYDEVAKVHGISYAMNMYYLSSLCMENIGYKNTMEGFGTVAESCNRIGYPERNEIYACSDSTEVPIPSDVTRVNSQYCVVEMKKHYLCKDKADNQYCQNSTMPSECLPDE